MICQIETNGTRVSHLLYPASHYHDPINHRAACADFTHIYGPSQESAAAGRTWTYNRSLKLNVYIVELGA